MNDEQPMDNAMTNAANNRMTRSLMGRGHAAGDFLEAWRWTVLEVGDGLVRVEAHLPDRVRNPRGDLFGGFTPTYVDLVSIFAVTGPAPIDADGNWMASEQRGWLMTANMHIDYFEPVTGPTFIIEGSRDKQRGRVHHVRTRFMQDGVLAAQASTTLIET